MIQKNILFRKNMKMDSLDDIQSFLNDEQFSKPWGRMSEYY